MTHKKAILFDLDGTLLPMDTNQFVEIYVKHIANHVAEIIEPELFIKALWGATQKMMENVEPHRTNEAVFELAFLSMTGLNKEGIWPLFNQFYAEVFPTLIEHTSPSPVAREIVQEAIDQGYDANPVFPRLAIEHRMKWANISDMPFKYVTVYEESSFTKPHPQYYQYIAQKMGVNPENCIMVGNDIQEDMSASQVGMKTFLVTDYVIDRGQPQYSIDDQSSLEQLFQKLKKEEGIFQKS